MKSGLDLSALSIFSVSLPARMFHAQLSLLLSALFYHPGWVFLITSGCGIGVFTKLPAPVTPAAVPNSKPVSLCSRHPDISFLGIVQICFPLVNCS